MHDRRLSLRTKQDLRTTTSRLLSFTAKESNTRILCNVSPAFRIWCLKGCKKQERHNSDSSMIHRPAYRYDYNNHRHYYFPVL